MSKPWYYTIGYPVKVLYEGTWRNGIICNGYRHEDGIINTMTEVGPVGFGAARREEFLKPNLPDDNPWIPVTERLPEDNQKVWITKEYRGGDRRIDTSVFKDNEFLVPGFVDVVCTNLVRAWMPRFVPEPYKEES
jgi:hypothetical protein